MHIIVLEELEGSGEAQKELAVCGALALLHIYFAPWGAAKGEIWEEISGDRTFSSEEAMDMLKDMFAGLGFAVQGNKPNGEPIDICSSRYIYQVVQGEIAHVRAIKEEEAASEQAQPAP